MKKKQIVINDWSGGITADFKKTLSDISNTAVSCFPNNLGEYNEGTQINLYRGGFLGHLSTIPSVREWTIDSGGTFNLPFAGLYDTRTPYNQDKIFIMVNGKVAYMDLNGGTVAFPVTGLSTNLTGSLTTYVDTTTSGAAQTIFVQTETGYSTINGANTQFNNQTPSAFSLAGTYNATGAPIKTIIGPNRQMYFTNYVSNAPVLGRYDPTAAGTFATNYSIVETGYFIQDMCTFGNYVAIIANNYKQYGSKPKLYIWDGQTPSTYLSIFEIEDHIALTIHEENGSLLITTIGDGLFKIRRYTGGIVLDTPDFVIDQSLIEPMTASAVQNGTFYNALNYNRIKYVRGMFFIQGYDGKVWYLGKPIGGKYRSGLHCIFAPSISQFNVAGFSYNSAGFIEKNPRKNQLIIGYRNSSAQAKIAILDLDSINSNILSGEIGEYSYFTTNIYEVPPNSTITNITVDFSDFSNPRAGMQLSLYKDYDNTTDYLAGLGKEQVSFTTNGKLYRYPINVTVNKTDMFYLKLRFASCSIKTITVEYSYDNLSAEG